MANDFIAFLSLKSSKFIEFETIDKANEDKTLVNAQ